MRRGGVLRAALAHAGDAADFEQAFLAGDICPPNSATPVSSLDSRYDDTDDDQNDDDVDDIRSDWQTPAAAEKTVIQLLDTTPAADTIDLCSPSPAGESSSSLHAARRLPLRPVAPAPPPLPPRPLAPPAKAPLTEAQRLRIEHNRQVALLKRRQRQQQQQQQQQRASPYFGAPPST